jgi:hypothetical protein
LKTKILIMLVAIVFLGTVTILTILESENGALHSSCLNAETALPAGTASSVQPLAEPSREIGAKFPPDEVKIQYIGFSPPVTLLEAMAIAKNWLSTGFNIAVDDLPVDATMALYSGPVRPPDARPSGQTVEGVEVWIVVIKELPLIGSVGPPNQNQPAFGTASQANIAIDATTRRILYGVTSGERVPLH